MTSRLSSIISVRSSFLVTFASRIKSGRLFEMVGLFFVLLIDTPLQFITKIDIFYHINNPVMYIINIPAINPATIGKLVSSLLLLKYIHDPTE